MPKKLFFRILVPASAVAVAVSFATFGYTANAGTVSSSASAAKISTATSSANSSNPADQCCDNIDMRPERIESAQALLDQIEKVQASMRTFHEHANEFIAQSKRLQGQAEVLQTKTPILPGFAKLSPSEYQAALKQYNGDLHDFALHAGAYDQHFKAFQATIGECHANEHNLAATLKGYEIHADQFHVGLPASLRPPHICGRLTDAVGDMSHQANSMMMDQKRVLEAQQELVKAEAGLQNAEVVAPAAHMKAENEAKRQQGEQALAAEFSKLKDEYDLLKIEKQRIAGNNTSVGKISRASVSAKVKNH